LKTCHSDMIRHWVLTLLFIGRQNTLTLELAAAKKKRNQLLDNNGFEQEITGTELLLGIIKNNPGIIEEYNEELFLQAVGNVIMQSDRITFRLINKLELTEVTGKEND